MPVGAGGSGPAKMTSPWEPGPRPCCTSTVGAVPRDAASQLPRRLHQSRSRATISGHRGTSARTSALPAAPMRAAPSRSFHRRSNASAIDFGIGRAHETGLVLAHELERSAAVGERDHRPRGREALDRDVAVVLVERAEVDAERLAVELQQPLVAHADLERDSVPDAEALDLLAQLRLVGSPADEHETHAGRDVTHRVDRERLTLQALHAAREHQVVAERPGGRAEQVLGDAAGVVQRLCADPERAPEAVTHVLRVREHALGLAERDAVGFPDHVAHLRAVVLAFEVGIVGVVPELVGGAVLMDQPDDLALVLGEVRRELQSDHGVDLEAVGFGDVEAPPDRHLMGELARRIPLAGDLHEVGLVAGIAEGAHQGFGVRLGPTPHERRLRVQHGDPHAGPPRGAFPSCSSLSRLTSASSTMTFSARLVVSSA